MNLKNTSKNREAIPFQCLPMGTVFQLNPKDGDPHLKIEPAYTQYPETSNAEYGLNLVTNRFYPIFSGEDCYVIEDATLVYKI